MQKIKNHKTCLPTGKSKIINLILFRCSIFVLLFPLFSYSQTHSNFRFKKVNISADSTKLDTLSIIPGSVIITSKNNDIVGDSLYTIDYSSATLVWNTVPDIDSVKVIYRVLPFNFDLKIFHKPLSLIENNDEYQSSPTIFSYKSNKDKDLFGFGEMQRDGSIGRGITIGNNQDLSVTSHLNLKISGKLSDDVDIIAAISDENIPIQPGGNTKQIQEFDKVFIRLRHDIGTITAGDFEIKNPESYFMKMYKKVQGGSASSSKYKITESGLMKTSASYAVAKGKYVRQTVETIEGNQGPYRLKGANGESFIIVLSGTERIFIDGKLLTRGENYDYVIDYNTAEITFTPNLLITKDSRILSEFEYSDKNYVRSLFYVNNEFEQNRLKLNLNLYSEQDNKNKPFEQNLTDNQKSFLQSIGDSIQNAYVSNFDSTGFTEDRVMYILTDTTYFDSLLGQMIYEDSILIHSNDKLMANYQAGFAYVGDNMGNYKQMVTSANGRIFQWLKKVNGISQGDYEPVRLLISPKQQQLYTFSASYKVNSRSSFSAETGISNTDLNKFTELHNSDNIGRAINLNYYTEKPINRIIDSTESWVWFTKIHTEYTDKYFKPIENYRSVEFTRDWNLSNNSILKNEIISSAAIGLKHKQKGKLSYDFTSFLKEKFYNGFRNAVSMDMFLIGIRIRTNSSMLHSNSSVEKTQYIRPNMDVSKTFRFFIFGVTGDTEDNRIYSTNDLLNNKSFKYNLLKIYIKNNDSTKNNFLADYSERYDYTPVVSGFNHSSTGKIFNFNTAVITNPKNQLKIGGTYRELIIIDNYLINLKPDKSILSKAEYSSTIAKGVLKLLTYYELGSGQELKKSISFEKVPDGQGTFIYTGDLNENGFSDIEEYELARSGEPADYIRVILPSNEYISSFINKFSQSVNINPAAIWRGKNFISRFSDQAIFRIDKKTQETSAINRYNPFILEISDTSLISLNSQIRNSLFFNRSSPVWGMDFNVSDNKNKIILLSGFDSRSLIEYSTRIRWNVNRKWETTIKLLMGKKDLLSEISSSKNYSISIKKINPIINFQPESSYRISLFYDWAIKQNALLLGGEKSLLQEAGTELRISKIKKGNLDFRFSYIDVYYNGQVNSSKTYEMIEGLKSGSNITWQLALQKHINESVQISFTYNGRKSEGIKLIHSGSVQARAIF